MASSLPWKVYTSKGEYIAAVQEPVYGAMLLGSLDDIGATIRLGHKKTATAWTDTKEQRAFESYDYVAEQCYRYLADGMKRSHEMESNLRRQV